MGSRTMPTVTLCPCGLPLHYISPRVQRYVEEMIVKHGPTIVVTLEGGGRFDVNRHYIALHGLKAQELESLADRGIIERLPTDDF